MVMSQGTYTFLACFAGFWLVWALIVMLCCFCSFLQRRLKRRREERLREQCLRTVEMEPLGCQPTAGGGYPPAAPLPLPPPPPPPPPPLLLQPPPPPLPREPPQFCPPHALSPPLPMPVPHPMPEATWVTMPDIELCGKPPCYEEAVLMEDPPPPYSEVLADPRGGTYLKPTPLQAPPPPPSLLPLRELQTPAAPAPTVFTSETRKTPAATVFPDRGYSSLIRLPSSQRWDSLGHLLSNMDLNHNNSFTPPGGGRPLHAAAAAVATMPRREARTHHDGLGLRGGIQGLQGGIQGLPGGLQGFQGVHGPRGLEPSWGLPTAFPLLGRSTAV